MHQCLLCKLLLGSVGSSFSRLQLDLKLDSLKVAIRLGTLDVCQLIPQLINGVFLLCDLNSQLFFFASHELCIVFSLGVRDGFPFSVASLFVTHELFKEVLELANNGLLLFNSVLVKRGLLVLLGQNL